MIDCTILLDAQAKLKAKYPDCDNYVYTNTVDRIIVYAVGDMNEIIGSVSYVRMVPSAQ